MHAAGRRSILYVVLAALLTLSFTSAAGAYTFYPWYTPHPPFYDDCQTGVFPNNTPTSCDYTGTNNWNQTHLLTGGGLGDVANVPTTSYCNYYNTGSVLDRQTTASGTGISAPAYQTWGDAYGNACQWTGQLPQVGNQVFNAAPGSANICYFTCGVQRFVSLQSQDDRPWNPAFGNPSLDLSLSNFKPGSWATTGSPAGGWAYLCPNLQDRTTGNVLEFCLQMWQPQAADAAWPKTDASGVCNTATNDMGSKPYDLTITSFKPGTTFATLQGDSSQTVIGQIGQTFKFHATISTANLLAAVRANNTACGRASSTNPGDYRLMGIENGVEAWRNFRSIGASSQALSVRTIYGTP